jgi:hypothetical protein
MKKIFVSGALLMLVLLMSSGCRTWFCKQQSSPASDNGPVIVSTEPVKSIEKTETSFAPLYVYKGKNLKENKFVPAGWMGDTSDIKFTGSYQENPGTEGEVCLRIIYLARGPKEWAGIYWQSSAGNWGDRKGGYDLRGATALTFWARGEQGGEKISEFKMGGITGKYPDSDIAWLGPVRLTIDWKQYVIPLNGKDLRYINGGFCFTVLKDDDPNGCTFYLADIRYE